MFDLLDVVASRYPGNHVVAWYESSLGSQALTVAEFRKKVHSMVEALRNAGLRTNHRLAVCAPTSLEWEVIQLAAWRLGGVVFGIDPRLPPAQGERSAMRFGAHWLVSLESSPSKEFAELVDLPLCLNRTEVPLPDSPLRPSEVCLATQTSGTTGEPKVIFYSKDQLQLAIDAICQALDFTTTGSRTVAYLPMAHLFQRMANLAFLAKGIPFAYCKDIDHLSMISRAMLPDFLISVPLMLQRLAQIRDDAQFKSAVQTAYGSAVRYLVSGTAPLGLPIMQKYERAGIMVMEAYGLSENIIPIAMNSLSARRPGTVGRPLRENQLRISPDGEVEVLSPGNFIPSGPAEASEFAHDGYLKTGDFGRLDKDGYLTITGRMKSSLKLTNGCKVQPEEIEAELMASDLIEHCIILGHGRPTLCALVYSPLMSTETTIASIRAKVREEIARIQLKRPGYEKVTDFVLLDRPFAIEAGELTLSLKFRRPFIEDKYRFLVEQFYSGAA